MAERSIVRELVTLLGFDVDEKTLKSYELRMQEARRAMRRFAIAAGIAGGAIAGIARRTARAGDNLVKTSQRLGLSVQALQEWRFVAERSGVATATFDMAMQRFGRRAAEAARGTGEAVKALARLRVQVKDSNGRVREMDALLQDALEALAAIESPLERNALAMKLFDSEGVRVVQMLEQGSEGMALLRKRFRDLGGAISDQTAQLGVEAVDAWKDFTTALNGVIFAMGEQLLPTLIEALTGLADWIAKNQSLVRWIGWVTIGVIALTAAVYAGIAAWKLWAALIALINAGLFLMIAKFAVIGAFLGLLILLAQDIGMFLTGGGETVTGRAIQGLKAAVKVAIDYWKNLIIDYIQNDISDAALANMRSFSDAVKQKILAIIEIAREKLKGLIPQSVLDAIEWLAGGGREGTATAEQQLLAARAQRFAQLNTPAQVQARGAITNVEITVNQAPGETSETVVRDISKVLIGKGITTPLVGLAR